MKKIAFTLLFSSLAIAAPFSGIITGPGPNAKILPSYVGLEFPDGTVQTTSANSAPFDMGTFDGQLSDATGGTITGNLLYLQSATASFPGCVNTSTQTFGGAKTFSTSISSPTYYFSGSSSGNTSLQASATASGNLTLPAVASSDVLVARATTDTLTNKTIAAGSNTISGLTNSNLSGSAAVSNANLATMATGTVKGNDSGSTATPSDLTLTATATNSSVMYRDSTGATALSKITVGSSSYAQGTALIAGTPGNPATTSTTQTNAALRLSTNTGNNSVLDFGLYNSSPYGAWVQSVSGGDLSNNYPLILQPNGGNVGIGYASPTATLHVNGTSYFQGTMTLNSVSANSVLVTDASKNVSYASTTGTGNIVRDTNPIFQGSITSPIYYGGTATNQGLTIQSTTGVGTADYIKFNVGNNGATEAARIDTSGNVGIGKNNPGSKLDVNGTVTATAINDSGLTASQAVFTDSSKNLVSNAITGTGSVVMSTSPTLTTPNLGTPSAATLTNATGLPVSTGISGLGSGIATWLATPSSSNLASAVTDETGSGSLVFGTAPTFSTSITDPLVIGGTGTGDSLELRSTSGVGATDYTKFTVGNNGATEAMRIIHSGNVGIGTTNPTSTFSVNGTSDFNNTMNLPGTSIVNSSGFIGIGTTSPSQMLHLYRQSATSPVAIVLENQSESGSDPVNFIKFRETQGASIFDTFGIGVIMTSTGNSNKLIFTASSSDVNPRASDAKITLLQGGNVGIGTTNPGNQLTLSTDSAAKPSTNTWTISSDIRLKDVKGWFKKGLKEILSLNPIYFSYKKNNPRDLPSDKISVGISAQEVQKVIPEAITVGKDGYLSFNSDAVSWAAINAIKELSAQTKAMKEYICERDKKAPFCD